jgi:hypothetical protein
MIPVFAGQACCQEYDHAMAIYIHITFGTFVTGDTWQTTMHSSSANAIGPVQTAWNTAVNNFLTGTVQALWPTDVTCTGTKTYAIDPVTNKYTAVASSSLAITGTGAGKPLDPRAAILTSFRTALPQKSGRGRMYWPMLDSGHVTTAGRVVTADRDTFNTGWKTALDTFNGTATPVVYHKRTLSFTAINEIRTSDLIATQRRRTNKDVAAYGIAAFP